MTMTMLFDPVPRSLLSSRGNHFRAAAGAIGRVTAFTIEAIGRLCHAFAIHLMRRQMRRAMHSLSDHLLRETGIRRSEIDAFVAEMIPHQAPPAR
jgi:uncharacterized protein YjiS (DUF1127 family)